MIRKLLLSIILNSFLISQSTLSGLDSWTHSGTIGLSGGGYLFSYQNEFRNAAMLVNSNRLFKLSLIKYPADINAQSVIVNGILFNHHFGVSIKHISYGIFESRSSDNILNGNFSASDTHIQMAYAKFLYKDKLIFGLNNGLFLSQIENSNAKALTVSPSLLLHTRRFSMGLTFQNHGRMIDSYEKTIEPLRGSIVFSIFKSLKNYPIEIELDQIIHQGLKYNSYHLSALYKTKNNIFIKGGMSSNRINRIKSNQFIDVLLSDVGMGVGYEFDNLIVDFNTYTYSNSNSIYGITIASKF